MSPTWLHSGSEQRSVGAMPNDEEMNLLLKTALLRACSHEVAERTGELTRAANELERESELTRRLIQDSRQALERIRLIHPEKDETSLSSETPS